MRMALAGAKIGIIIGLTGVLTFPITITGVRSSKTAASGTQSHKFSVTFKEVLRPAREADAAANMTRPGGRLKGGYVIITRTSHNHANKGTNKQ
jgi:hypothetical protein